MIKEKITYCTLIVLFFATACTTVELQTNGNNLSLTPTTTKKGETPNVTTAIFKEIVESPIPQKATPESNLNITPTLNTNGLEGVAEDDNENLSALTLTGTPNSSEEENRRGNFFQIEVVDPTFSPTGWSYIDFDLMEASRLDDLELKPNNESIDMGVYLQEDESGSLYFYYIPKNGAVIFQLEDPLIGELSPLIAVCQRNAEKFDDLQTGYDFGKPICLRTDSNLIVFVHEGAETYKDDLYFDGPHRTIEGYILEIE